MGCRLLLGRGWERPRPELALGAGARPLRQPIPPSKGSGGGEGMPELLAGSFTGWAVALVSSELDQLRSD